MGLAVPARSKEQVWDPEGQDGYGAAQDILCMFSFATIIPTAKHTPVRENQMWNETLNTTNFLKHPVPILISFYKTVTETTGINALIGFCNLPNVPIEFRSIQSWRRAIH